MLKIGIHYIYIILITYILYNYVLTYRVYNPHYIIIFGTTLQVRKVVLSDNIYIICVLQIYSSHTIIERQNRRVISAASLRSAGAHTYAHT